MVVRRWRGVQNSRGLRKLARCHDIPSGDTEREMGGCTDDCTAAFLGARDVAGRDGKGKGMIFQLCMSNVVLASRMAVYISMEWMDGWIGGLDGMAT